MLCVKMYAVCRSHLCIVNVREYEVQDTFPLQGPPKLASLEYHLNLIEASFSGQRSLFATDGSISSSRGEEGEEERKGERGEVMTIMCLEKHTKKNAHRKRTW